jgi:hypothetical protein
MEGDRSGLPSAMVLLDDLLRVPFRRAGADLKAGQRWKGSKEGEVCLCLLEVLYNVMGLRYSRLLIAFKRFVPNYKDYLGRDTTDRMITSKSWAACYATSPHRETEDPKQYLWYERVKADVIARRALDIPDIIMEVEQRYRRRGR